MRLCSGAQARSIASKPGDGAAVVDVVAVGLGQIPVYVAPKSGGVDRSRRAVKALRHPAREAEIAEYLDPWTDPRVTRSWLALAGAAENRYTQEMLPALLQSRTPKLLVWDEDDPFQTVDNAEGYAREIAETRLVRIKSGQATFQWKTIPKR